MLLNKFNKCIILSYSYSITFCQCCMYFATVETSVHTEMKAVLLLVNSGKNRL